MSKRILPSLFMSAKRSVWRMHDHAGESDKAFAAVRHAILDETQGRCAFCGHHSTKYQEVHHLDDDHKNNAPKNLATACPLCHQVFHIGLAGMREGGEIYYLPEFSQAEANAIALMLWIVEATVTTSFSDEQKLMYTRLASLAKSFSGFIETRRHPVFAKIKNALEKTDFPKELIPKIKKEHISLSLFSNLLMTLPDDVYAQREDLLGGLRIFPKAVRFSERIKVWADEEAAILPMTSWAQILTAEAMEKIVLSCAGQLSAVKATQEK